MEEKIKKAIKTSLQGIVLIFVLSLLYQIYLIISTYGNIYIYLTNQWYAILYLLALATTIVLYAIKKYKAGALTIIITSIVNICIYLIVTAYELIFYYNIYRAFYSWEFGIIIPAIFLGMVIPGVLIYEARKVLGLLKK